jgi:DNA topoisomerase-1
MNLVIVESPTKAKTISRFLGRDFLVKSSYGHIRDLPKSELGVDIKNNFKPTYVIPEKSKKIISELKKDAQKAEVVILATDEDREGEAIAWHLTEALGLGNSELPQVKRIVFHEITERALKEALQNPRGIDMNLVNAQQARRILDRLVGYELSPFLWRKVHAGLSAGRVQSAALRLIVERERERERFKPQEYWTITASLKKLDPKSKPEKFEALLVEINRESIPQFGIKTKEEAEKIASKLKQATFEVEKIEKKETKRKPLPPFTTSTLQQAAWQFLRFSAKQTMRLAQELYENGYITYMRTDSTNLSAEALEAAKNFLKKEFGERYVLSIPRQFVTKSKLAQEAHEAIRPTNPNLTPAALKKDLAPRQLKLYDLIWRRFLASQMPEAELDQTLVDIAAKVKKDTYTLRASGQIIRFDGFLRIWRSKIEERELPQLEKGEGLELIEVIPLQHFTEPPPRYTDASLVKALEEYGIGRPSTYAPIIATLEMRNYVERDERKTLKPTGIGIIVTELLEKHFPTIVDYGFTALIENELDEIAKGQREWVPVVREVYLPFHENLLAKEKEVTRKEATERPSEEICDKCGRPMVTKYGRFGPFLACSGFPECKNVKKIPRETLGIKCPKCGKGEIVLRRTKTKKRNFYGCSRWPECDFASWKKPAAK